MSVFKIPCILATTIALHVTHTPPNPSPTGDERPHAISAPNKYLLFTQPLLKPAKGTLWAVAFAETLAIIMRELPSSSLAHMFSAFPNQGDANNIHLTLLSVVGMMFIIGGGLIRFQCYRALEKFFTFEMSIRKDHRLVTHGPYGIVRHPSYTAVLLAYIGAPCWYGSRGAWLREFGVLDTMVGKTIIFGLGMMLFGNLIALLKRIPSEDEMLKKSFGKEWEEWAQRVPYVLIPGVY